jgi:hypothetical protein
MTQMYHYATVSKALDELNENGLPTEGAHEKTHKDTLTTFLSR